MLLFWIIIFIVSLAVIIKGADWLLGSAEKIGLALGLSPFIVGVTIVGVGTSFPEVVSSLVAVFKGVTEIAPANAIGSNIANILLIVGISSLVGKRLTVSKSLIDLDLPLLAISTVLFVGVAWDKQITFAEALLLIALYGIYLLYTVIYKDEEGETKELGEVLPSRTERRRHAVGVEKKAVVKRPKISSKNFLFLGLGIASLVFGAKYLIDSVIKLSEILNIAPGVISLVAVAFGTSLPELFVSVKAALQRKSEMVIGTVFGSNVFNILIVTGLPGLFRNLELDAQTFSLGLPVLVAATFLFIISGISRRIHNWEGAMYLCVYLFFIGKLFGFL